MANTGNGVSPKGQYLFLNIHEAWAVSQDKGTIWDDTFQEGFVRGEMSVTLTVVMTHLQSKCGADPRLKG